MNTPATTNNLYTHHYHQPAEYHFCQDSVLFARWLSQYIESNPQLLPFHDSKATESEIPGLAEPDDLSFCLDIGTGCGVLAFELAHHQPKRVTHVDCLEIQELFFDCFDRNRTLCGKPPDKFRWVQRNYDDLLNPEFADRYRLIFSNPPYFFPDEGRLSPSTFQNRCRFFLDSTLNSLVRGILHALSPESGVAFVLMKSGEEHGQHRLRKLRSEFFGKGQLEFVGTLRQTQILKITGIS